MRKKLLASKIDVALESYKQNEVTISTEGFFGDLLKNIFGAKTKEELSKKEQSIYEWLKENTDTTNLNPNLKLKSQKLTITLPENFLLDQDVKEKIRLSELMQGLKKDLKVYLNPKLDDLDKLSKAEKTKAALEKALEDIESWEKFRKVIIGFKGKLPVPYKLKSNPITEKLKSPKSTEIEIESIDQLNKFISLAFEIVLSTHTLEEKYEYASLGLDMTDQPFRRFSDEISDDVEVIKLLDDFMHPTYDENYPNQVEELVKRIRDVFESCIRLVQKAVS